MSLYHFSAKIISRANGQSACAASAYCSAEKIKNEYDGRSHDYRKKHNVSFSTVMLPDNAPVVFADRSILWNAVEQNEKQTNAQLAREVEFALPIELPDDKRRQIALEFIQENFVDEGMCADVSFHNPPKMDSHKRPVDDEGHVTADAGKFVYNNPHVHVLLTMRPLDKFGKWEAKKQKLYVCEKAGIQRLFTSEELKKHDGWEKLYNYQSVDGHKSWHTKAYAEVHQNECLEQVNRYPKSDQRTNPKVERWNSSETLIEWRAAWADKVNNALAEHGIDERVDHRSYKDQGLNMIPTVHEGKAVTIAEKRLKEEYERKISAGEQAELQHTDIRNLNNAIRLHNEEIRIMVELKKMKQQMDDILKPVVLRIEKLGQNVAERLEDLRLNIIDITVKIKKTIDVLATTDEKIEANKLYIKEIRPITELKLNQLRAELQIIEQQLNSTNKMLHKGKFDELIQRRDNLKARIVFDQENRQLIGDAIKVMKQLSKKSDELRKTVEGDKQQKIEIIHEYNNITDAIPYDEKKNILAQCDKIRNRWESIHEQSGCYNEVVSNVDDILGIPHNAVNEKLDDNIGIRL